MNKDNTDLDQMVNDIDSQSSKEQRVFAALLDKYAKTQGKVFAFRNEMGYTMEETGQRVRVPSFVIVRSLDWIGKEILMGSQMPFMQGHIDTKKGTLQVNESIAESVKQRAPNWTRQAAITAYLAHDRRRKFGTIVAVLSPPWVDDLQHENWSGSAGNERALKHGYKFQALDSSGRIGLLDLSDTLIYALDGQHRVMGIRGIQELRDFGHLTIKGKDGQPKAGKTIGRDDFLSTFQLGTGDLQAVLNDTMTIELIPSVLSGELAVQASQRVRSVFVTINAYAQATAKGETALLDESDGYAIVGRKAAVIHPLFKNDRVNWKTSALPARTRWYTTLDTLKDMAKEYLSQATPALALSWETKFDKQVPMRPEEPEIELARTKFFEFLDYLRGLPVFVGLGSDAENGKDLDNIRFFPGESPKYPNPKSHLLLRPIGQVILARAVGRLVAEGMGLGEIFNKLNKWDQEGGFTQHLTSSAWYGVTFDFSKGKMNSHTNESQASKLLQYMVRGADEGARRDLVEFLVNARRSGGTPDKPKWVTFSGETENFDPIDPAAGKQLLLPIDRA